MTMRQECVRPSSRRTIEAKQWVARHMADKALSHAEITHWKDWMSDPDNSAEYDAIVTELEREHDPSTPTVSGDGEATLSRECGYGFGAGGVASGRACYIPTTGNPIRLAAVVATIVVASCLVYGYLHFRHPHPGRSTDAEQSYVTIPGQRLKVGLPDGSVITLSGNTVVETWFSPQERLVVVEHGEALFQVASDPQRSFRVVARGGSITALGTEFDVRCYEKRVLVTVTRGVVEVGPSDANGGGTNNNGSFETSSDWVPVRVSSNQRMTYSDTGASAAQPTDALGATTWTDDDELRYRRQPLGEVIEDVQRMSQRKFEVEPAAADLPYTGTIRLGSVDQWLKDLERIFPVKITPRERGRTLIALREPSGVTKSR